MIRYLANAEWPVVYSAVAEVSFAAGWRGMCCRVAGMKGWEALESYPGYWSCFVDSLSFRASSGIFDAGRRIVVDLRMHSRSAVAAERRWNVISEFPNIEKSFLTDSCAFSMGFVCCRFNRMFAADCWFQLAGFACAELGDCWAKGGCRGDSCDALFTLELFPCWKLLKSCWFICCCCGESRWPPLALKGFCWKSTENY